MYFLDRVAQIKENARCYQKFNNAEKFLDFVSLLTIMEEAVDKDQKLQSRQLVWIDTEKNKIRTAICKLLSA